MTPYSQIVTFVDVKCGLAVTITHIKRGYAVTFLDTDAEQVIETRIYPHSMEAKAIAYAKSLID